MTSTFDMNQNQERTARIDEHANKIHLDLYVYCVGD